MKNFKNILKSRTVIFILLAILATIAKQNNIDLPIVSDSPEIATYVQYISLILAAIFRFRANKKLTV
ncbi:hypothetical protein [Edaphocola aurantiacus]|uniref:hypothetical protein n=1 Tax=Edaphocola aurantiacus TaxID=2601682 RepID=UPI001C959C1A|nr:hypothetical protein [Edaphocola aurantiacus]